MIGFFPDPYPDELLYSVCARYHQRTGYAARAATARDLFGHEQARVAIDLPSRLSRLTSLLPPGHAYAEERLMDEHTLLPLYAPFMPAARLRQLREAMKSDEGGGSIHARTGMLTAKLRLAALRFCPACAAEDRQRYGETYWHRLHQIPGVQACSTHTVWLEASSQSSSQLAGSRELIPANQIVPVIPPRGLSMQSRVAQAHWLLAQDVSTLLNHPRGTHQLEELHGLYQELLFARALATPTGAILMQRLKTEFLNSYAAEFLADLRCGLERRGNWLVRMVRASRNAQPPIQHLLFWRFLGYTAAEFLPLLARWQPFGDGPWPCVNPVCESYRKSVITTCQITEQASGQWQGTFQCACGFGYRRHLPPTEKTEERQSWVVAFGAAWEAKLRKLLPPGGSLYHRKAKQLGVNLSTAQAQAIRLNLVQTAAVSESCAGNSDASQIAAVTSSRHAAKRALHRQRWQQAVKENPAAGRAELRRLELAAYNWLKQYDGLWFETASPPRRPPSGPPVLLDWKQRDADFAAAVRVGAEKLLRTSGRPNRITKSLLAREIGAHAVVTKRAHLVPLTIAALEAYSESVEACAERRIQWAAESFRKEGQRAGYWRLLQRAAVGESVASKPEIQTMLRETLEALCQEKSTWSEETNRDAAECLLEDERKSVKTDTFVSTHDQFETLLSGQTRHEQRESRLV